MEKTGSHCLSTEFPHVYYSENYFCRLISITRKKNSPLTKIFRKCSV